MLLYVLVFKRIQVRPKAVQQLFLFLELIDERSAFYLGRDVLVEGAHGLQVVEGHHHLLELMVIQLVQIPALDSTNRHINVFLYPLLIEL